MGDPIPAGGGSLVKEHPFGVCDACRQSCTGKSRVAARNCAAIPNAKRSANQRQLGQ